MTDFDLTGLDDYITAPDLESEQGVWIAFPGDREFLVLRAGGSNTAFSRRFQQLIKPHRKALDKGTLDPEIGDDIVRQAYVDTVIKGWRGIKDRNGNAIPYSRKVALEYFAALPELFKDLQEIASSIATFQKENLEETKDVLGET